MNAKSPVSGRRKQPWLLKRLGLAGLLAAAWVALPVSAALVDQWRAADITDVVEGGEVWQWPSQNGRAAWISDVAGPTFHAAGTPAGGPVLRFRHAALEVDPDENPVGGLEAFTVSLVLKINTPSEAEGGSQWWQHTPIIDANEEGEVADWGTAVTADGAFAFGVGGPDRTVYSSGVSVNDGKFHILTVTWQAGESQKIFLDNWDPVSGGGDLPAAARNAALLVFGGAVVHSSPDKLVDADIAEIRFYDQAFTDEEALALANELADEHGVKFERLIQSFAASANEINAGEEVALTWSAAPDAALSITPGVGDVGDHTTNGVGRVTVTPANDTEYTLWAVRDELTNRTSVSIIVHRTAAESLVDAWDAASAEAGAVTTWTSENGRPAHAVGELSPPTVIAEATPAGTPAVAFAQSLLEVAANHNPLADATEATIAYVIQVTADPTRNEGDQWWQKTGVINAREAEDQNSWGAVLSEDGEAGFGTGNPDNTVYSTGGSLADGRFHVVIQTWGADGMRLYVDDRPVVESSGTVSTLPRDAIPMLLGGVAADVPESLLNGQLAEIRFYDENLAPEEVATVRAELTEKHGLGGGGPVVEPFLILDQGFNDEGAWFVTFESVPGVRYTLEHTSGLGGEWTAVSSVVAGGAETTLRDADAAGKIGYYRVVADASGGGPVVEPFLILDQGFNDEGAWFVTFESVPGVRYTLEHASGLGGEWTAVSSAVASEAQTTLLDASAAGKTGYYRVVAEASGGGGELEPFAILRGQFGGGAFSLVIQSVPGHSYTLLKQSALGGADWQSVDTQTASGEETTLTDPNASDPTAFYRVSGK